VIQMGANSSRGHVQMKNRAIVVSLYNSSTFCQNSVFWNFHLEKVFFGGEVDMTPPILDVANRMAPFLSKLDEVLASSA